MSVINSVTHSASRGEHSFEGGSEFTRRHVGPGPLEQKEMLQELGCESLEQLCREAVPPSIRSKQKLALSPALTEVQALAELFDLAHKNHVYKSYQGMGYYPCITPAVILRNVLESPGWYTQYTPYQAEISQGRLEALINFQTMICDLTGLPVANASLLDEATAMAEAMALAYGSRNEGKSRFFVSNQCHPQSIEVLKTRAEPLGIELDVGDWLAMDWSREYFGVCLQYPGTGGEVPDCEEWIRTAHSKNAFVVLASDPMSLVLLRSPGELGADIAIGSAQRFGVPMGFGGPHAAFMATKEVFTRKIPGRLIGVSKDTEGNHAFRLALQTREQHIRREKATSNICTAQVLLAIMSSFYAVYHGPEGLRSIAERIHYLTGILASGLQKLGHRLVHQKFFDTLQVELASDTAARVRMASETRKINLRYFADGTVGVSLSEASTREDVQELLELFGGKGNGQVGQSAPMVGIPGDWRRKTEILTHAVFNSYHSETEMLRYIRRLESKDLSLAHSMIPLGSCTMKLNATAEMIPVTWPEFGAIHPFAPEEQTLGYRVLFEKLEKDLAEMTGFAAVSLQPNAGSQGEYAGLLVIRKYHREKSDLGKDSKRDVCLIPKSAHGTNPASASMAGLKVVVVECDAQGNIDIADLKSKAEAHSKNLAALMVTYPSTHGVFEEGIREICEIVHRYGGLVYMDGANMNAQIGLCRPGEFGPDVCHLNLHKTFCIPHGGGGPGMGPIAVNEKLAPYLPTHPFAKVGGAKGIGPVSAAPWGSSSILPIPYAYIRMMGAEGLTQATEVAILNANYVASRLNSSFPVLYKGSKGRVAHECILDLRPLKAATGIEVEDVAKRLMDYGFHAPTISFPVPGTLMIEPTESESKAELDRFCEAMISIRAEIRDIEDGKSDAKNNVLKHAPHTALAVTRDVWDRPYSREKAAFPLPWVRSRKFWPSVSRIDAVGGDRNFTCTCPPVSDYA